MHSRAARPRLRRSQWRRRQPGARHGDPRAQRGGMNESSNATKWIGQSVERLEDPPLVTGRGRFAADINFARQLHMRVVRSNHAHANILSIYTDAARDV